MTSISDIWMAVESNPESLQRQELVFNNGKEPKRNTKALKKK